MIEARGVRIGWADLPASVRGGVEEVLGDRVISAVSQPGGFSPGTADRVVTAAGQRAFVKAVSSSLNPRSPALHRREIEVTRALGISAVPRLLGSYDDGAWVALILDDVDGVHPVTPWRREELDLVLAALAHLADEATPSPLPWLASAAENLADDFAGWRRLRADPHEQLDDWARDRLDRLVELADIGLAALAGNTLVHIDLRADNILLRPDGAVVFVDWPWACSGPRWLDTALLLINVALYGGHDVDALLTRHCAEVDPDILTGVLAAVAGYFLDAARRPDPPGLPTVRAFQKAQGATTLAWARGRI